MMTPRERLFAFLNGEPCDRVPVWLLFPYHPVSYYADVRTLPLYRDIVAVSEKQGAVWLNRRNLGAPFYTPDVTVTHEDVTEGSDTVERTTFRYRNLVLTSEQRRGPAGVRHKPLLASEEDLATYAQFPIECDEHVLTTALDSQIAAWRRENAEFPSHLGAMMNDLGEPIGVIYHQANLEEYAIWSLTMTETMAQLLDRLMTRYRIIYRHLLEQGVGEVFFMVGSELASPPLVSRKTFQQWVVPYARDLIAMVHDYGKHVIQHYHGQIKEIMPDFLTMAPDALHTIEAPPVGNCTLTEAFEIVGDRIGLIGNIQYDEFHRLSTDAMEQAVREVLEECHGKRFMLSPTAGPYETEVTPRLRDNYLRFLDAASRYGVG
ncbi:MAG TPA: uroporphyrinogen decarboxylase family protein [Armatimonadota bacterium]|nr:uroporphyrinogen decarboxylase family protein [Armatimonadota bacterium]